MTSTTLDVALCLLLVSAGALTLATAERPPDAADPATARAPATVETLATTTDTVEYTLAPGAKRANDSLVRFPVTEGPEFERARSGTAASLLAAATVEGVAVDGERLTRTHDGFRRRVRAAVARDVGPRVQVVAVWRPYPGAHVGARTVVGPSPPAGATVHAATLDVPIGVPGARPNATAAVEAGDGYAGVANVVAARLVAGLFPPRRADIALHGDYPVTALMRYRYRRAARLYGADLEADLAARDPSAANRKLADAVSRRVERDLRREFDSPAAAARAVRLDEVHVVVRTWSE